MYGRQSAPPHDLMAAAAPGRWLRRPFSFDVKEYPLSRLLTEFAAAQGVGSVVSPHLKGAVTGAFAVSEPGELLDVLCRTQHMNWYYDGAAVHFFSNAEMTSRMFDLQGGREEALRRSLADLGLFDSRFEWRVAGVGEILLAQGPAVYLDKIGEVLRRQQAFAEARAAAVADAQASAKAEEQARAAAMKPEKKLGVFRLNHAWAAERTIVSGDSTVTLPGVADLLRQIVTQTAWQSPSGGGALPTPPGQPRLRRGAGIVGRENAAEAAASAPTDGQQPSPESEAPFIQADMRLNAVLVWDAEENLPRLRHIVETLDTPLPLVEIRAAIVDVEVDRTRDLGVSWERKNSVDQSSWFNDVGSNVGSGGDAVDFQGIAGQGLQYATIFKRGLDQFMMRVSALEREGSANILSRPSVLTQDNIQATLENTETFYVRLEGNREVDLADITTGLTLRVTPHVIDDGTGGVQLAVYIVNGNDESAAAAQVDSLPRVRQSTISTQAVVHEGEALIIGGYYNETRNVVDAGVPVLKNIPGLGALFRQRSRANYKSERLFILSPRIVYPGQSPLERGTEAERMLTDSPGREMIDGPPYPDAIRPDKRKRKAPGGDNGPVSLKNIKLLR